MKRINNIYKDVISIDNLKLADRKARRGKMGQYGVVTHIKNEELNIWNLHNSLYHKRYATSEYKKFIIFEPKEREIFSLPYVDRIVHHAVMNKLEPMFTGVFVNDCYACVKGKGIHAASKNLKKCLKDVDGTEFCLKLDIKKFYPSIDHDILKSLLRRKIKDNDLLWLLDGIIDSAAGVPIGNYLSQYFANFYLSYFDHWLKESIGVKYYFRYADDIVILHHSKAYLHKLRFQIEEYLSKNLKLQVKGNYQVFPVDARGIDFVGYVHFHWYTRLRKSIKQNFARMLVRRPNGQSIGAYYGWAIHCNSKNLLNKLLNNEKLLGTKHYHHKLQSLYG
ncbi:MAG: reverse transcriptase [Sphingobacteriaceae bacterium]|nr:reverse transcriptase [Sphingobacteriaceae bacterium]